MRCIDALTIIIQGSDGPATTHRQARAHVAMCPRCASVLDVDEPGDPVVLPTRRRIGGRAPHAARVVQVALAVLCGFQVALAVPWLVAVNPLAVLGVSVSHTHLVRDGVLGLAVSAAGVLGLWRSRHVIPAIVVAAAVLVAQAVAGTLDQAASPTYLVFELVHLAPVAILGLLTMIAGSRLPPIGEPDRQGVLRLLDPPRPADETRRAHGSGH